MSRRKLKSPDLNSKTIIYCGAFSLMAITGKNHEQAKRTIRTANGWTKSKRVMGLCHSALLRGFSFAGYTMTPTYNVTTRKQRISFHQWLCERRFDELHATYLVALTTHYVIVNGNEFIDTYTRTPVKVDDAPHRRAKVEKVWRISN